MAYQDPGATATDIEDGDLTAAIVVTGEVDTTTPGTYERVYSVTDSGGKSTSVTRTVVVSAPLNKAPVVTLNGNNPDTITADLPIELVTNSPDNIVTVNSTIEIMQKVS